MRNSSNSPSFVHLASVAVIFATLSACAPPLRLQIPNESHVAAPSASGDAAGLAADSITLQVRYFPHSPGVSVLAWRSDNPAYGLRGSLRNDGSLIRGHYVYVSTSYEPSMPLSPRARIPSRPLEASSGSRDDYACHFGECSPFVTMGALIPDDVLRATSKTMPVKFYEDIADRRGNPLFAVPDERGGLREVTVTIDPMLIIAYLATVDSVSAELRGRH